MGERKRKKNTSEGKKKRKKIRAFATPETRTHALHPFLECYALLYCGVRAVIKA